MPTGLPSPSLTAPKRRLTRWARTTAWPGSRNGRGVGSGMKRDGISKRAEHEDRRRRWRRRSGSTAAPGGRRASAARRGSRARRAWARSSIVIGLGSVRSVSRARVADASRCRRPQSLLGLGHLAACRRDLRATSGHRAHRADGEGPGQERQRADHRHGEGDDREVEDQSHGARRVADRPISGRCAWVG